MPGERDRNVFNLNGYNIRQCVQVEDEVRGTGYRLVSREIMLYLDPKTGEAAWTYAAGARVDGSPVLVGDRLFIGTQGGDLVALNRGDGSVGWKFEGGGSFTASPSVAHNRLFIGSDDGVFYCFGASE